LNIGGRMFNSLPDELGDLPMLTWWDLPLVVGACYVAWRAWVQW
jgi:hypothetical protein